MRAIQTAIIALLVVFYGVVAYLALSPRVGDEYRAYYVDRATPEWRPVRYPAQPHEGFDLSRPGYPAFVRYTAGISGHEGWGRWTDARLFPFARIVFNSKFAGTVCVSLVARPAGKQLGREVIVRFGGQDRRFVTSEDSAVQYQLDFSLDKPSDVLDIVASAPARPREWDASNSDPRKLGLALHRLVIRPGRCDEGEAARSPS